MLRKKIRIPTENAEEILRELAKIDNGIEFIDLRRDYSQTDFKLVLHRVEEINRKINSMERMCKEYNIPFYNYPKYEQYFEDIEEEIRTHRNKFRSVLFMDYVENEIMEIDKKLNDLILLHSKTREDLISFIEEKYVLKKNFELISGNFGSMGSFAEAESDENGLKQSLVDNLNLLAGVVSAKSELKMKRMIFRISRGRAISTFYDLRIGEDEYSFTTTVEKRGYSFAEKGSPLNKSIGIDEGFENVTSLSSNNIQATKNTDKKIFIIIFQSGPSNILYGKLLKICEIFGASRYYIPKLNDINQKLNDLNKDLNNKKLYLIQTESSIREILLRSVYLKNNRNSKYVLYRNYFNEQRQIYLNLNKCIIHGSFIDGEVWIPKIKYDKIVALLNGIYSEKENKLTAFLDDVVPYKYDTTCPPTFIPTNEFTWPIQEIVNTYGIPHYQEINPAYFSAVTFPFLFGMMYGDVVHGALVLIFGLYLWRHGKEAEKKMPILKILVKAKYMIILMGFFSMFCGFIYNEFISVQLQFGTCYKLHKSGEKYEKKDGCVYGFGIDAKWYIAKNELAFINSLKMKLSVIFGVAHMLLGLVMKIVNDVFTKDIPDLLFMAIPQIIFFGILFGYMDFLIFLKWSKKYPDPQYAPDIKSLVINIILKLGSKVKDPLWGTEISMRNFHIVIVVVIVICILLMIFPKTFIDYNKAKKRFEDILKNPPVLISDFQEGNDPEANNDDNYKNPEIPKFGDYFANNLIATIEYSIGTLSNTASYLRLWALSLAHCELGKVFFTYCIMKAGRITGIVPVDVIALVIGYFLFAWISLAVLLFMDLLECFLHTLRLHWVEFQGKFYKADGYIYTPFCFKTLFNELNKQ